MYHEYDPFGEPIRHWSNEHSSQLQSAIHAYSLNRANITTEQITRIREYLCYWINAPCWNPGVDPEQQARFANLRERAKDLRTTKEVSDWLNEALTFGIDPL